MKKRILLTFLLIMFCCQSVYPVDYTRYVDTGSGGGDGTTNGTGTGGVNAYATLDACESWADGNVSAGETCTIHLNRSAGDGPGGVDASVTFAGWDAAAIIVLIGDDFDASGGGLDNTKYYILNNDAAAASLSFTSGGNITLKNVQVYTNADDDTRYAVSVGVACTFVMDSCIMEGAFTGAGAAAGVLLNNGSIDATLTNCLIHGFVSGADTGFKGVYNALSNTTSIINCTIYGNYYGVYNDTGTVTVKNTAVGISTDDFLGTFNMDYIVSDDDHSGDCSNYHAFPTNGTGDWSLDFTTPGSNFILLATATNLIDDADAGVAPAVDIMDTVRPQGGGDDIGTYEYVSGANAVPIIVNIQNQ